jgi:hypothetical protein
MNEYCIIMATPCRRAAQVEFVKAFDETRAKEKAKSRWGKKPWGREAWDWISIKEI